MKKPFLLLLFPLLFIAVKVSGNPIMVYAPVAQINEHCFNAQGEWTLELKIWFPVNAYFSDTAIKQIEISSNSGIASVLHFSITSPVTMLVIRKDSLSSPLYIDPAEDVLTVTVAADGWTEYGTYFGITFNSASFSYGPGNMSNQILTYPQGSSMSLIDVNSYYYVDTSPTIGSENDTIGGLGLIHGKLFDSEGNVFTSGLFKIQDNLAPFMQFNDDSTFSMVVPANNWYLMYLNYYPDTSLIPQRISNEAYVNVEPGKTALHDIHLGNAAIHVGIDDNVIPHNGKIVVAPNPFSSRLQFYFTLESLTADARLVIYTSTGKEVYRTTLPGEREFRISVDGSRLGAGGIYYYAVTDQGKKFGSGKLLYIP